MEVRLFVFVSTPIATHHLFGAGRRCTFYCNRLYLRRFLHFWQLQINYRVSFDTRDFQVTNEQISGLKDMGKYAIFIVFNNKICSVVYQIEKTLYVGLGDIYIVI